MKETITGYILLTKELIVMNGINRTVVHNAILEAKALFGRLSVICERVPSPNME
jgi:hypothetical protein